METTQGLILVLEVKRQFLEVLLLMALIFMLLVQILEEFMSII